MSLQKSDISHLSHKQHAGAILVAGGRLWFDAIDYPVHWGLQSSAVCE